MTNLTHAYMNEIGITTVPESSVVQITSSIFLIKSMTKRDKIAVFFITPHHNVYTLHFNCVSCINLSPVRAT